MDIETIDQCIKCDFFWRYRRMLEEIGQAIDHMFAWADSCGCHRIRDSVARCRHRQPHGGVKGSVCPMRGRRAFELAAGGLHNILDGIWATSGVEIAMRVCEA